MFSILFLFICVCSCQDPLDMLNRIDSLHQSFFDDFGNLVKGFPPLFEENATWIFPIGQPNATQNGRKIIQSNLASWASLLHGERSFMTSLMVAGTQGSYWWKDIYLRDDPNQHPKASDCMFSKQGFTSFSLSQNGLINEFVTWQMNYEAANSNVACGLNAPVRRFGFLLIFVSERKL